MYTECHEIIGEKKKESIHREKTERARSPFMSESEVQRKSEDKGKERGRDQRSISLPRRSEAARLIDD